MTTKAKKSIFNFKFKESDIILLGRESKGAPKFLHEKSIRLKIPISKKARSLNVAVAATISSVEALRQIKKFKMDLEDKKIYADKWFSYLQEQICMSFEKIEKNSKSSKNLTQQPGIKVKNQRGAVLIKF